MPRVAEVRVTPNWGAGVRYSPRRGGGRKVSCRGSFAKYALRRVICEVSAGPLGVPQDKAMVTENPLGDKQGKVGPYVACNGHDRHSVT
jgi:hypothetical protein